MTSTRTRSRSDGLVITCPPRVDGALSLVRVQTGLCVTSMGEELIVRWEKLRTLCEQACQEGWPIWIRTWTSLDGEELIEFAPAWRVAYRAFYGSDIT